ncbi:hypothetical protein FJZ27_01665 [Candidatus Peribacteria bacterium]|nr:hypothetical protein [Candidatus Peribacteria bacterium]
MARIPEGFGYIAAYLGGVATLLVLQALQPQTKVVVVPGAANILARPTANLQQRQPAQVPLPHPAADPAPAIPAPEPAPASAPVAEPAPTTQPSSPPAPACSRDEDCTSPTSFCAIRFGVCQELAKPTCACQGAKTLVCTDAARRMKSTACAKGCVSLPSGGQCVE